jgi:hypothetical protein
MTSSWGVAVADWVRNTVMLTVMLVWSVYVAVTLIRGDDIDAIVWGLPGAVYFALNPTWKKGNKDGPR